MIKVYIFPDPLYYQPVLYTWQLFCRNKAINYVLVADRQQANVVIADDLQADIVLDKNFYKCIAEGIYAHTTFFKEKCLIHSATGPDYLSTAFYMINSLQEYGVANHDEIGRFNYHGSYQYQYKNNTENLVQRYFDAMIHTIPALQHIKTTPVKSAFFLSHDIDAITTSFLQEGLAALKQGKWAVPFVLLVQTIMQRPYWLNMDKIMNIESEYDFKSTFYWLVNKGRLNKRETNADYSINSKKIVQSIRSVAERGFENGLHKSISADSFTTEITKAPFEVYGNRYHYLKFRLPDGYEAIEASGLKLDASLGFADAFGFRNSFGMPFKPYNFKTKTSYSFIEVPLTIMDGTFKQYMKIPVDQVATHVIDFFEKNNRDAVISLLWHNTFFSDYKNKGYLGQYKKILAYLYETNVTCLNQKDIIAKYL